LPGIPLIEKEFAKEIHQSQKQFLQTKLESIVNFHSKLIRPLSLEFKRITGVELFLSLEKSDQIITMELVTFQSMNYYLYC